MKSLVLNFFLLVLEISLNLTLDTSHKHGRFFKTLLKKSFKFISSRRSNIVIFDLSFMLLLAAIDLIVEE